LKRIGKDEEDLLKTLPEDRPFTTREVKGNRGSVKTSYILCSLEERGLVRRKGRAGKLGRYVLWEKKK
jgi:chromosome segregation and condensation protein ScpB